MKLSIAFLFIVLFCIPLKAGVEIYEVEDISDSNLSDENDYKINQALDELWISKSNKTDIKPIGRQYKIQSIADPAKSEENAFAINENVDALVREKVSASSDTIPFLITDLDDPKESEDNEARINLLIDWLDRNLQDAI